MAKPLKKRELLHAVEKLLRQLHASPRGSEHAFELGGTWFMVERRGVALTDEEARAYFQTLELLRDNIPAERHGDDSLRRALQRAVAEVTYGTDFERDRLAALRDVAAELDRPSTNWIVLIEVRGLEAEKLGQRIGFVRFVKYSPHLAKRLRAFAPRAPRAVRRHWVPEDTIGRTFAQVSVEAVDVEAATTAATEHVRTAVDVVNFYAEFLAYASPLLYLPGDRESTHTYRFAYQTSQKGTLATQASRRGPLALLPLAEVMGRARANGFKELSQILHKRHKTESDRRILQAVRAAGRAAGATTTEARLLSAVTALEAALLGPNKAGELSYRLRIRCAHLLGRRPSAKKSIFRRVSKIYEARSAIAHTGSTGVSAREADNAVTLACSVIVFLLTKKVLHKYPKDADFEDWLTGLTLR